MGYMLANVKLIQSWRYKTLAVIKRHKNHLSFFSNVSYRLIQAASFNFFWPTAT